MTSQPTEKEINEMAFSDFCASFPARGVIDLINDIFDESRAFDACVYEIRRRTQKHVNILDAENIAWNMVDAREMHDHDNSEIVTRFTL